jgi:signal peptidase
MKIIAKTFYWLIIFSLLVFSSLATFSKIAGPGNFRLLTVESGSMEPAIKSGSVILVLAKNKNLVSPIDFYPQFQKGEIITFLAGKETFTHRIVEVEEDGGKIFYKTKGDANPGADVEKIPQDKVLGKVIFSLPYLGFIVSFAKSQIGFIALIIVPATIIIYSEILNIKKEIQKIFYKRKVSVV